MATFIKAGFWEKLCKPCKGYKGWLNLDEFVKENSGGPSYKVYTALLSQSGTDAPVATILENTLGGTPVWTRTGAGYYVCTLNGAFTPNKTFCSAITGPVWGQGTLASQFGINDSDKCELSCFASSTGAGTDIGNYPESDTSVEIRVYP